jgi:hypothetical protein
MNDNLTLFLVIGLVVYVSIIILFYSVLSSIDKNSKRTNHLLKLLYEKDGTRLTHKQLSDLEEFN